MRVLRAGVDLDAFFARVRKARRPRLLLDYDGTLAPFRAERDDAVPYPGVREWLAGRRDVVIVSGRAIDDLLPLLNLDPPPEIWGSHGWERRYPDGRRADIALDPRYAEMLRTAQRIGPCEVKPYGTAFHTRGIDAAALLERVRRERPPELDLHEFDGGLELRPPGRNKGNVVHEVVGEPIVYLGDDATDEDAFKAVGDRGLGVLVRPEERPTAADVWLRPPEELLEFLHRWP